VREVSREPLVIGGGHALYLEPTAVASSDGALLLAGTPSYLWRRAGTKKSYQSTADSVFGVVVPRRGSPRIIPAPIDPRRIASVRALERSDGHWDVAFAELDRPRQTIGEFIPVADLWAGVFDGTRWRTIGRLPRVAGATLEPSTISALVRRGDTLALAVTAETSPARSDVVVYERRGSRWSYGVVPVSSAMTVSPAYSERAGLTLAVVQLNPRTQNRSNSVHVYARVPDWQEIGLVVDIGRQRIIRPSLVFTPASSFLTWLSPGGGGRSEARAVRGVLDRPVPPPSVIDSNAVQLAHVKSREGTPLWIAEHLPSSGTGSELRVLRESARGMSVVATFPNPFTGPFCAAPTAGSEVLLAGPRLDRTGAGPTVVTLFVRLRVECGPGRH
jgi:hypothetical protein